MPILKHAIKKLKQDKKRTERNKALKTKFRTSVKNAQTNKKDTGLLGLAFSAIDKAAKKGVIHTRKADRMKSRLTKFISR
jgi:small subunit ribosomal protein S20